MSSSMPIPQRKRSGVASSAASVSSPASASSSLSTHIMMGSSIGSAESASSSPTAGARHMLSSPSNNKGKQKVPMTSTAAAEAAAGSPPPDRISARRPSLLGSSLSHSEYTVVNLGHSDGPPRLVSCVKSSQGFDWNQELFLPSYAEYDSLDLEHRPDPVEDIILTDEEAAAILPRW